MDKAACKKKWLTAARKNGSRRLAAEFKTQREAKKLLGLAREELLRCRELLQQQRKTPTTKKVEALRYVCFVTTQGIEALRQLTPAQLQDTALMDWLVRRAEALNMAARKQYVEMCL